MDKPTKPTNLMPRSFGGAKENFSATIQQTGIEAGVPTVYGGANFNYQMDATGKELDYCEKICDFINAIPIGKTITVDANNKLVYSDVSSAFDTLELIYPVGSIFLSTTSTCPLAAFFGTWQVVGTSIITSVSSAASVVGDGNCLGLTDGSGIGGMYRGANYMFPAVTGLAGKPAGTTQSGSVVGSSGQGYGVTSTASKSGLQASITRTSLTVNIFKRTA